MSTLYVDIDDTLCKWMNGPGLLIDDWEPNEKVWKAIAKHKQEFDEIVFWSLGGGDYAMEMLMHEKNKYWREEYPILKGYRGLVGCETKIPRIPQPGDLFIDDMSMPSFASATIHPDDLL